MIALLAATIVIALTSLGAYISVAAQRDRLELRVTTLELQLRLVQEEHLDSLP